MNSKQNSAETTKIALAVGINTSINKIPNHSTELYLRSKVHTTALYGKAGYQDFTTVIIPGSLENEVNNILQKHYKHIKTCAKSKDMVIKM